ncbi:MAG: glycosyltransferase family 39 protein [Betaproteobacteria bacterium]|jgi:hypothetical protein
MTIFSTPRFHIVAISVIYLVLASLFATVKLDVDEFAFIREPYELLGGDYTKGYVKEKNYKKAFETAAKSYFFYWQYRPLFSPIVNEHHKTLFAEEESRFGYSKPERVESTDPKALVLYQSRMIVPEPDRFYSHGAGKPLLPALLSIPQLALVSLVSNGQELLHIQHSQNYHPLFVLTRLVQIVSGLLTVLLVYFILKTEFDERLAGLGAAVCAFFPTTIQYFPNLHHDSIMVPFLLASSYFLLKRKYVIGGVAYGLALASKNTAVFLLPALLFFFIWQGYECYAASGLASAVEYIKRRAKELAVFGIISLAILTPFANPVSFAMEILTPITHRNFDPRGEKVDDFSLSSELKSSSKTFDGRSVVRPEVQLVQRVIGTGSVFFFFIVLAVSSCFQAHSREISKLSVIVLLTALPYGLVFGYGLGYRQLMFVPFFSILCAELLTKSHLKILLWILLCISVIYSFDPISTTDLYTLTR